MITQEQPPLVGVERHGCDLALVLRAGEAKCQLASTQVPDTDNRTLVAANDLEKPRLVKTGWRFLKDCEAAM